MLATLSLAHLGCVHMKALAKNHVLWPGIDSDIEKLELTLILKREGRTFLAIWANPIKTPSMASPVRNSFWKLKSKYRS